MDLISYTNSNFSGKCLIHPEFAPFLDKMNVIADRYQIKIIVTSSFRPDTKVAGAIVVPAVHGNHLVGHAVDVNLKWKGELYNSTRLYHPMGEIRQFIEDCKLVGIRWGGDFHPDRNGKTDPVHFDSGLNVTNFPHWEAIYKQLHS